MVTGGVSRWVLAIAGGLLLAAASQGGALARPEATDPRLRVEFLGKVIVEPPCRLRFAIRVTDENGIPDRSLTTSDFRFFIDGRDVTASARAVEVARDYVAHCALRLALVVDTSISVRPSYKKGLLSRVQALLDHLDATKNRDEVGLVVAGPEAKALVAPTGKYDVIRENLPPAAEAILEGSPLHDALLKALEMTSKTAQGAVVVFTDGKTEGEETEQVKVIEGAKRLGCPIYVVEAGAYVKEKPSVDQAADFALAVATGGEVFPCPIELTDTDDVIGAKSRDEGARLYEAIRARVAPEYRCSVTLGSGILRPDGRRRVLQVAVTTRAKAGTAEAPFAMPFDPWRSVWVWLCGGLSLLALGMISLVCFLVFRSRPASSVEGGPELNEDEWSSRPQVEPTETA